MFFFKQKTAYEVRISDWSSDVCSSDLMAPITINVSVTASVNSIPNSVINTASVASVYDYDSSNNSANNVTPIVHSSLITRSEERRVGKECVSRVDLGGRRIINKKKKINVYHST